MTIVKTTKTTVVTLQQSASTKVKKGQSSSHLGTCVAFFVCRGCELRATHIITAVVYLYFFLNEL